MTELSHAHGKSTLMAMKVLLALYTYLNSTMLPATNEDFKNRRNLFFGQCRYALEKLAQPLFLY